jgi:hypothetical protein
MSLGYDAPTAVNVVREVEPLSSASKSTAASSSESASNSESISKSEIAKPTKTGDAGHIGVSFAALFLSFVIAADLS